MPPEATPGTTGPSGPSSSCDACGVRDPGQARAANHRNVTWVWLFQSECRAQEPAVPAVSGRVLRAVR